MAQKLNVNTSVVDYLKSTGEDSSFAARKQLAVEQGIVKKASDYTGTAAQNTALLSAVKADDKATTTTAKTTKASTTSTATTTSNKPADAIAAEKAYKTSTAPTNTTNAKSSWMVNAAKGVGLGAALLNGANNNTTVPLNGNIADRVNTSVTNGIDSTATAVVDNLTQLIAAAIPAGGNYTYKELEKLATTNPELKGATELAKLYGLDYNLKSIYDTLMKNVDAGYNARFAVQDQADSKYYDNAATAQSTLTDTLRKQQSQAMLSGANKGMQAAQALSAMLGTSQQFAANATQLAMDRENIGKEYAADQAKAGSSAFDKYTAMGQQLADVSKNLYSSDTSKYVGQLDYNSSINTANAQMASQSMAAKAQWESTYASSIASAYQAYYNGQITLEQARIQADAAIQSAKVYGLDASSVTAAANKQIAQTNADATTAAATIGANATTKAATIAGNSNVQAAVQSAGATTTAAQIAAQGYVDSANANNAATAQAASANLVTGIISGYNAGSLTGADAQTTLDGYLAAGLIDQNTYNSTKGLITKKDTTTTTTTTPTTTPTTGTSSNGSKVFDPANPDTWLATP